MFEKHVFVCTEGKTCPNQGSQEIFAQLRQELSNNGHVGLNKTIRINKAGCLAQCGHGPMMVVYPEGVWYCQVASSDCKEIIDKHLSKNQVIERLLYSRQSGTDKVS